MSPRSPVDLPIQSRGLRVSRRVAMAGTVAAAFGAAVGCADDESVTPGTATGTGSGSGTGTGTGTGTTSGAPVWSEIPDQVWTVGQPVEFDLAGYCTDPDGDPLSFSLDTQLPPGLTLEGSVIRGTPAVEVTRPAGARPARRSSGWGRPRG